MNFQIAIVISTVCSFEAFFLIAIYGLGGFVGLVCLFKLVNQAFLQSVLHCASNTTFVVDGWYWEKARH